MFKILLSTSSCRDWNKSRSLCVENYYGFIPIPHCLAASDMMSVIYTKKYFLHTKEACEQFIEGLVIINSPLVKY